MPLTDWRASRLTWGIRADRPAQGTHPNDGLEAVLRPERHHELAQLRRDVEADAAVRMLRHAGQEENAALDDIDPFGLIGRERAVEDRHARLEQQMRHVGRPIAGEVVQLDVPERRWHRRAQEWWPVIARYVRPGQTIVVEPGLDAAAVLDDSVLESLISLLHLGSTPPGSSDLRLRCAA